MRHHVREASGEDDAAGEARQAGDDGPPAPGPLPPPTVRCHRVARLFHRRRGGGGHAPHERGGQHADGEGDGAEEHHRHHLRRRGVHVCLWPG